MQQGQPGQPEAPEPSAGPPAPPPAASLRRTPVQQRSADRLARILDACAELLDEVGYEQLSTRAVAARAGVPIGSVYRFFSNKRALAEALAHRNLDRYTERITTRLETVPAGDWRGAVDAAFDEYVDMKRTVQGFAFVDFGVMAPGALPPDGPTGPNEMVAERLAELLSGHFGREPDDRLRRTLLVAVEAVDALLQLAFRTRPDGDAALVDETRTLLHAYLSQSLP